MSCILRVRSNKTSEAFSKSLSIYIFTKYIVNKARCSVYITLRLVMDNNSSDNILQIGYCIGGFDIHIWALSASPSVQAGRL